jgi:hypothetical protein
MRKAETTEKYLGQVGLDQLEKRIKARVQIGATIS